jgi:hypothetical protein
MTKRTRDDNMRPLQNAPFCPMPASGSNFNPRNTQCMSACPVGPADRTGVVKIFAFLGIEPRVNIKTDSTGQAKLDIFQRSQDMEKIKR